MTTLSIAIGSFGSVAVDIDRLPEVSREFIFAYGLRQILNDAHAGVTATVEPDEEKRAAVKLATVDAKLQRLYAGELRAQRTGGDPVAKEAERLALAIVKDRIRAAGRKLKEFDEEALARGVEAIMAKQGDALREQARKNLEAAKAPKVDIDLTELGLE